MDAGHEPDGAAATETRRCWRCSKFYGAATAGGVCPFCGAPASASSPLRVVDGPGEDGRRVARLIWGFVLLLSVSLLMQIAAPGATNDEVAVDIDLARKYLVVITTAEVIDTLIVAIILFGAARGMPLQINGNRTLGWALLIPFLVALLAVNFAYHHALLQYTGIEPTSDAVVSHRPLLPWVLVVYCVQPAIVEEWFFRYFCLGVFSGIMGRGAAIFVSSLMFGLAHLGGVASLPVYVVIGIGLAYVRVLSGSLLVPMALHFLHNLAIVVVEISHA